MKAIHFSLLSLLFVLCACEKQEYDASGVFEAKTVTISPEVSGNLIVMNVEEGDIVTQGQEVCLIDTTQLYMQRRVLLANKSAVLVGKSDAETQVAALNQQIDALRIEQQRVTNLIKDGAAPQKTLDDINGQILVLKRQIEAIRSSIGIANTTVDGEAQSFNLQADVLTNQISKCHVKSPINGTVMMKYAEQGEMAITGHPLMKVADLSKIYLRAYFSSEQLAKISIGQTVEVIADYGGKEQHVYQGTIQWISSESEFTPKNIQTRDTRTNLVYAAKVAVKNDGKLKIGMAGQVRLKE